MVLDVGPTGAVRPALAGRRLHRPHRLLRAGADHRREARGERGARPHWQVLRCALGDADEEPGHPRRRRQGPLSSLLPACDFGKRVGPEIDAATTVAVLVKRLDGMFDELVAGIDEPRIYLKLDTQGFDLQAFAGAGDR